VTYDLPTPPWCVLAAEAKPRGLLTEMERYAVQLTAVARAHVIQSQELTADYEDLTDRVDSLNRENDSLKEREKIATVEAVRNETMQPLGDGRIQITCLQGETAGLLTVRGKDHDISAADCDALSLAFHRAAMRLRAGQP